MFGELIGLWAAAVWRAMGAPEHVRLDRARSRPRHADGRRAARREGRAGISQRACRVHLVETSPALRAQQEEALGERDVPIAWHATSPTCRTARSIIIANEFFDALPVHQAVKTADGWHERMVGIDGDGGLAFAHASRSDAAASNACCRRVLRERRVGAIFEWRSDRS